MQPRPVLSDMPDHIKQRIVDSLDTVTKRSIRRCSTEFKSFFNSSPIHYHQLILHIRSLYIGIRITIDHLNPSNKLEIEYHSHPKGHLIQNDNENFEKLVEGGKDYLEAAAEHFWKIWKDPKVTVKNFYLSVASDSFPPDSFSIFLNHLNRARGVSTLSAKTFNVYFGSDQCALHPVLSILKPGHLKTIEVEGYPGDSRVLPMDQVVELAAWQQARELYVQRLSMHCPISEFQHFEVLRIRVTHLEIGMVRSLVENFVTRNHQFTDISYQTADSQEILEYLKQFEVSEEASDEYRPAPDVLACFDSMSFWIRR